MRSRLRTARGQIMLEHAVLVAVIVAAVLSMAVYLKRAINSKYREVGDAFGQGRQFEPGITRDERGLLID